MDNEYPTEEQLQAILDFKGSPRQFIEYIDSIWWADGFTIKPGRDDFKKGVKRCTLSTWGWSGNEDIIGVMKQTWFWMLWWRKSERGGHYEFEVPNDSFLKSLTSVSGLETFGMPHSNVDGDSVIYRALEWALSSDTGVSSEALCAYMALGITERRHSAPSDASDRGRCIRLLKKIPGWVDRLDEMKKLDTGTISINGADPIPVSEDTHSWTYQIPLILAEGGFDAPVAG